ncbi:MAG: hypothetical protein KDK55_00485 [Chlamydiia bacterium]|nr:hypothetical protein [Chlamydiia bacterium]
MRALDDPLFLEETFVKTLNDEIKVPVGLEELYSKEHAKISHDLDITYIQDSWSWRNRREAQILAQFLVDDNGEISDKKIKIAKETVKDRLYSLGTHAFHDDERKQHLLNMLNAFAENKLIRIRLKQISKPMNNPLVETLIRETLGLSPGVLLTDVDTRRAALAALFTSLRQNVGSCFATAPAILIQQCLPEQFFLDMGELIATGRLSRTFYGIEHVVPLSQSWGLGDLRRPFYLATLGPKPWKRLAKAPGLIAALSGAGLISSSITEEEKMHELYDYLAKTPLRAQQEEPFALLTAEKVIDSILKTHYGITDKDIEQYAHRPKDFFLSPMTILHKRPRSNKRESCSAYFMALGKAKESFKAITDNALLKSWEFTVASFAETKADFARWNLHASLGLNTDSVLGIGSLIHEILKRQVDQANHEIEENQSNYDHLFAQVKTLEGRLKNAKDDREAQWIHAEYRMRMHELNRVLNFRDEAYDRGRRVGSLAPFLGAFYQNKFREFFQEVYDASMLDVETGLYDDSPAGFRLLYKHGRSNTSAWTMINNAAEYVEALSAFFIATEGELSHLPETEGIEPLIGELVTGAVSLIKREDFLEHSIYRLAEAYGEPLVKQPLKNLDKVQRKPWAYTSGGTMNTLVSSYWGMTGTPHEESRWVENETELLAFLLDTMKDLPQKIKKKYLDNETRPLLAFSPTHAFLIQPGRKPFVDGWQSDEYTYTWIRDTWSAPAVNFYHGLLLDTRMLDRLNQEILKAIPPAYHHFFEKAVGPFSFSLNPQDYREHVLEALSYERWTQSSLAYFAEELDAILFNQLPLFPEYQLRERLELIFSNIDEVDKSFYERIFSEFEKLEESIGRYKILTSVELRNIAKALLVLTLDETASRIPFHKKIVKVMQKEGLSSPRPMLFADTNWVRNLFGFMVGPGTGKVELWRFDTSGCEGRPMSIWKKWVNGTEHKQWGLYTFPHEYGL